MLTWSSNKLKFTARVQTWWLNFTSWNLPVVSRSDILLPCLSLLHCGFFPQCKTTSRVKRTRVRILLVPVSSTTWLSHRKNGRGHFRLQHPLVEVIGNVAYAVSPDPPGEEVLAGSTSGWRSWWRWLLYCCDVNCTIIFFLGNVLP